MIVLGLDASTTATGWGVIRTNGDHFDRIDSGVIRPKRKGNPTKAGRSTANTRDRCVMIAWEVAGILNEHAPELVGMENVHVSRGPRASLVLARLAGMLEQVASGANTPVRTLSPAGWRKSTMGNGKASKADALGFVFAQFGLDTDSHDEAEALCIAVAAAREAMA